MFISGLELSEASFKCKHTIEDKTKLSCNCLVGPGLFILGSYYPTRLTLYDTTEMKPVSHLDLQQSEGPYDVCLIPGDKVAVMCTWSNTIVIVSVKNNQLHREHAIRINRRPVCMTGYTDDLFVVTVDKRTDQVSISRVTLTGDRHVLRVLPKRGKFDFYEYSMTTSKESEPKIYVSNSDRRDVLEVSLDGSTLRYISMSPTEGYIRINHVVSVGENILCLISEGIQLILADIKSEKTSTVMKQKTEQWRYKHLASVCPVTKTLLLYDIWDLVKHKIKVFKWK